MNGGILPLLLLCSASGFALANASRRAAWLGIGGLVVAALLGSLVAVPETARHPLFVGLLVSTAATAATVYLRRLPTPAAVTIGVNNGVWAGALAALLDMHAGLAIALFLLLLLIPAQWLAGQGYAIVTKVLASWIIAIAALAGMVSFAPTPGYAPDHMQ